MQCAASEWLNLICMWNIPSWNPPMVLRIMDHMIPTENTFFSLSIKFKNSHMQMAHICFWFKVLWKNYIYSTREIWSFSTAWRYYSSSSILFCFTPHYESTMKPCWYSCTFISVRVETPVQYCWKVVEFSFQTQKSFDIFYTHIHPHPHFQ
jgi:hypothetical protein